MVNYLAAIKRPFANLKRILLGALLMFFPIINFFSFGYIFINGRYAMSKIFDLPPWKKNYKLYFKTGFAGLVIMFIYYLPVILFAAYFSYLIITIILRAADIFELAKFIEMGRNFILLFVLFIISSYFAPAGILNYTAREKFSAAFDFKTIIRKTFSLSYLIAWLISSFYCILTFGIFMLITYYIVFPIISYGGIINNIASILLVIFQNFVIMIAGITQYTMLGESYYETYWKRRLKKRQKQKFPIPQNM
jgi:hypothetical protein